MTTTVTKVETKWDSKKTQETTANVFASVYFAAHQALSKAGQEAQKEFQTIMVQHKIQHYKTLGVKTPMELVKAIAETEHNLFGSQIEISGDDNKATLKYNSCAMWDAMQKHGKFTPEQEKAMGEQCTSTMSLLAKDFGLKFEPNMGKDTYEMTFSK